MDDEDIFEDAVEEQGSGQTLTVPRPYSRSSSNSNSASPGPSPKDKSKKFRFPKQFSRSKSTIEGNVAIHLGDELEEARRAVDLFLNNNFEDAREICEPLADRSIYLSLGYSVFMFLKAVMTFEVSHIEEASAILAQSCDTIAKFRKKTGLAENLGRMVRKADYDSYTEVELHAEVCYAECLLLKAALTFCEDETLVSFVKAGLKVRTCYQGYRECWSALQERNWENSDFKRDFEGGVRLGVGSFNLLISLLPSRVMKLLEFIGFSGNRDFGLSEIMWVQNEPSGLRQFLSSFLLLGYHLLLSFFVGSSECDIVLCKKILDEKLSQYPDGAFFLFFKARYHFVQGELRDAITWYSKSVASQNDWPQFHHICYWELYWANSFNCDHWEAVKFADRLFEESRWSKCIYAFQKGASMIMVQDELNREMRKDLDELMRNVPKWKQRIAGKSLPMEKFVIKKAQRFLDQNGTLCLPAFELIYVWNGFRVLAKQYHLVEKVYIVIDKKLKELEKAKDSHEFYNDDYCLVNLLKAMCLKAMKSPLGAEECLRTVMSFAGKLKSDTYLVPFATFEFAALLRDQGEDAAAMEYLEKAKNDYKDYNLQNRLHFRVHAVQEELKAKTKASKAGLSSSASANNLKNGGERKQSSLSSPFGNGASSHEQEIENFQELTEEQAQEILRGK